MEQVRKRRISEGKVKYEFFNVYTKEEADLKGLKYVPFNDVKEGDLYVLTHDNYVVDVFDVKHYTDGKRPITYVKLSIGAFFVKKWTTCSYTKRKEVGNYTTVSPNRWKDVIKKEARMHRLAQLYAHQLIHGRLDWEVLGRAVGRSKDPVRSARKFLKQEGVMELVDEKLKKLMEEEGLGRDYILKQYKKAIELSISTENAKTLLACAEALADLADMKPNRIKATMTQRSVQLSYNQDAERLIEEDRTLSGLIEE